MNQERIGLLFNSNKHVTEKRILYVDMVTILKDILTNYYQLGCYDIMIGLPMNIRMILPVIGAKRSMKLKQECYKNVINYVTLKITLVTSLADSYISGNM